MVLNSQITRSSLKPQNHRGAVTDALRLVMQFRQIGVETGRAADEVWQTETRRTELGSRRQSARAPRSRNASRWRLTDVAPGSAPRSARCARRHSRPGGSEPAHITEAFREGVRAYEAAHHANSFGHAPDTVLRL